VSIPHLNILTDSIFPVTTASGARRWSNFLGLLAEDGDYPVAFDWPRGDLNVASAELAIGLLALVYRPASNREWEAIWAGPSEIDGAARVEALAPHFNLFGDAEGKGPRFCQDFEALTGEANAIEGLFIDTPGVNGQKKNSDLMTHRGRFPALGLKAAAMALYALQQFAPSGGAGHRTSMRGGGPMTTLVLPATEDDRPVALRHHLLLNLPILFGGDDWLDDIEIGRALPWLRPTITSEGKPPRQVAEADPVVHPVQAFFGMPRRIRLVAGADGTCPLTGEAGPLVTGFVQKPWGMNYSTWRHPLTPYRQTKDEVPYSVKPKAARFGYRDWVGITVGRDNRANKAFPAATVAAIVQRSGALRDRRLKVGMLAAGWAMNNMEAESFLESIQPLYLAREDRPEIATEIANIANRLVEASEKAAQILRGVLNGALFDGRAKSTDTGIFEDATDEFYGRTEVAFHALLGHVAAGADKATADDDRLARDWLRTIHDAALAVFDEHASNLLAGSPDVKLAGRVTAAYATLSGGLSRRSRIAKDLGVLQPADMTGTEQTPATASGA